MLIKSPDLQQEPGEEVLQEENGEEEFFLKASPSSKSLSRCRGRGRRGAKPRRFIQFQARLGSTGRPSLSESHSAAFLMVHTPVPGMGLEEGLPEGLLQLWREQGGLAWVVVPGIGHGLALVVAVEGIADPAGGVAQGLGHLGDGVAGGEKPYGVPAGALHGVFAFPVQGVQVVRVMPQLEFQPGAALVFGQVHAPS
jgi:hypothetical protein